VTAEAQLAESKLMPPEPDDARKFSKGRFPFGGVPFSSPASLSRGKRCQSHDRLSEPDALSYGAGARVSGLDPNLGSGLRLDHPFELGQIIG
jgi:hypothetical protein